MPTENSARKEKICEEYEDKNRIFLNYFFLIRLVIVAIVAFGIGFASRQYGFEKISKELTEIEDNFLENAHLKAYKVFAGDRSTLEHVEMVLKRLGYAEKPYNVWDILWIKKFPVTKYYSDQLVNMQSFRMLNYFFGLSGVTKKSKLSMINPHAPKSFRLPDNSRELQEYSNKNPHLLFVQKDNNHRGISIKDVNKIDFNNSTNFVQQYIHNPLLVDGHKFDIGVYTIITSLNPLRIYIYEGDVLFRYCLAKYNPFDPSNLDKYVLQGIYIPTWKMPSLSKYFNALGLGMKDSFNAYMKNIGMDHRTIWSQIDQIIAEIYLRAEDMTGYLKVNPNQKFFQLVRVDFLVDENLKVYLLEVNAGPNLSSRYHRDNFLLYEQVLYNALSLVGVARRTKYDTLRKIFFESEIMLSAERNIMISEDADGSLNCTERCNDSACILNPLCLDMYMTKSLHGAYREHVNRLECRRVFPPTMNGEDLSQKFLEKFTPRNQIMIKWFNAKCKEDVSWC